VQERQEASAARGADYSQSIIQCQTKTLLRLDTGTPQMASVRPASPGVSEKSSDYAPFGRGDRLGRDLNRPGRDAHPVKRPPNEGQRQQEKPRRQQMADLRAGIGRQLDRQLDGKQAEQRRELDDRVQ